MAARFNLLRKLEENWMNRQNRFDKAGENLLDFMQTDCSLARAD